MTSLTRQSVRFVAGRDLDGGARTDSRWRHRGTTANTPNGHASRWAYQPHRRRSGIRLAVLAAGALAFYGVVVNSAATAATVRVAVWLALAIAAWMTVEKARRYVHRREVVAPLAEALAGKLGDSRYILDPRTWLAVPVDFQDRPTRVYLPRGKHLSEPQEKQLVKVVANRLGLASPSFTFDMRGEWPFMEVRPAPAPRDLVRASDLDVRALLESAEEGRPLLGLAPRDVPNYLDLDIEAPHIGLSMATGGGKSVAVRTVLAQGLHHGGIAMVLDRKVESQLWAMHHPGVRYACTEQEIYDALMWASDEINRRFALVRERSQMGQRVSPGELGPRFYLNVEELNTLEIDLRLWWRTVKAPGDPTMCPALPVLGRFLAMGRAAGCHALVVAQKLTCQAIGGTAARENLSTRILGRATASTWRMLAPECAVNGKFPQMSKHRGRVHVVFGDEAAPVQIVFFTEDEAREYALSGTVTPFPNDVREVASKTVSPAITEEVPHEVPHLTLVQAPVELVTLADYAKDSGIALKALRNARDRDHRFPAPAEPASPGMPSRYAADDLDVWAEARPHAGIGGDAS